MRQISGAGFRRFNTIFPTAPNVSRDAEIPRDRSPPPCDRSERGFPKEKVPASPFGVPPVFLRIWPLFGRSFGRMLTRTQARMGGTTMRG